MNRRAWTHAGWQRSITLSITRSDKGITNRECKFERQYLPKGVTAPSGQLPCRTRSSSSLGRRDGRRRPMGVPRRLGPIWAVNGMREVDSPALSPAFRIHTRSAFGLLAGVLVSVLRACIRLCGLPERGDRWRSRLSPRRTTICWIDWLGQPHLSYELHRLPCVCAGRGAALDADLAEEVLPVRGTHWK